MALITPVLPRDEVEFLPGGSIGYGPDRPDDPDWVARDEIEQVAAVHSLAAFLRYIWPVIEPGKDLKYGKHIDVVCFGLEQLVYGRIEGNELVIAIPPRMLKSIMVNVAFPAWVWLWAPWLQTMGLSGAADIALRDNRKMRTLIESPRYARLKRTAIKILAEHGRGPGEDWQLVKDQNQAQRFSTSLNGMRFALASGAKITGEGCDLQIVDDPIDAKDALEGTIEQIGARMRQAVVRYEGVWSSRLNSPGESCRVLIMQRLRQGDLADHLISEGAVHIVLPMRYNPDHPHLCPFDWRTQAGELLLPDQYPEAEVRKKEESDDFDSNSQFGQLPSPAKGGSFERDNWSWYDDLPIMMAQKILKAGGRLDLTADCAAKEGHRNAYTVIHIVGYLRGEIYVFDEYRAKVELPELIDLYETACREWVWVKKRWIEDASNGTSLIQIKKAEGDDVEEVSPQEYGGKETRAGYSLTYQRKKKIWLPRGRDWADKLVDEHALFPTGTYKDRVDTISQAAIKYKEVEATLVGKGGDKLGWLERMLGDPITRHGF